MALCVFRRSATLSNKGVTLLLQIPRWHLRQRCHLLQQGPWVLCYFETYNPAITAAPVIIGIHSVLLGYLMYSHVPFAYGRLYVGTVIGRGGLSSRLHGYVPGPPPKLSSTN